VVILDLRAVPDIEYTGLKSLTEMEASLRSAGTVVKLAAANPDALAVIQRAPLGGILGEDRLCSTLHKAVDASTVNLEPGLPRQPTEHGGHVVGSATLDRQRDQLLARHRRRLCGHDQVSQLVVAQCFRQAVRAQQHPIAALEPQALHVRSEIARANAEGSSGGVQCGGVAAADALMRPASATSGPTVWSVVNR
jgi:hypothetical protein